MERKRTYVSMIYLLLLIIVSFIIRLIPHRNLLLAAYDEYLHRDLTLRIAEGGIGAVSRDLPSLLGLRAYSYPPLFHIVGAFLYRIFHSDYFFLAIPAVYGTFAVLGFYFAYKELFEDEKRRSWRHYCWRLPQTSYTEQASTYPKTWGCFCSL